MKKDFLCIADSNADEINEILARGAFMKKELLKGNKSMGSLKGKSIATLFYENSTRTKNSFENACKFLGAEVTSISAATSSIQKGETLIDTGITLDAIMTDAIIIRHSMAGSPKILADNVKASVINGGDGMHAHPTQAILDMFTMKEYFGRLEGLEVAIIGDIKHSRVARSNIVGLLMMGANVKVYGPNTLLPIDCEKLGCKVCKDIDEAFKGSDVVMGLRIQLERQQRGLFPSLSEYTKFYGITKDRLTMSNKGVIVMHPGPVNRGVEISHEVFDMEVCVKDEQVTNGIATRMALLEMLLTR